MLKKEEQHQNIQRNILSSLAAANEKQRNYLHLVATRIFRKIAWALVGTDRPASHKNYQMAKQYAQKLREQGIDARYQEGIGENMHKFAAEWPELAEPCVQDPDMLLFDFLVREDLEVHLKVLQIVTPGQSIPEDTEQLSNLLKAIKSFIDTQVKQKAKYYGILGDWFQQAHEIVFLDDEPRQQFKKDAVACFAEAKTNTIDSEEQTKLQKKIENLNRAE